MFQEQRPLEPQLKTARRPGPKPPRSVTTTKNIMSESTSNRRAMLGQSYYEDAKKYITQALSVDERGDCMQALELYNKSLTTIRSGLAVLQSSVGAEVDDDSALRALRGKMEGMKEQIKRRMEVLLQSEVQARSISRSTTTRTAGQTSLTGSSLREERERAREETKADLMFNMDTGIDLFEVDGDDHIRKYSDVDAFSVFQYRLKIEGQPPAFLQCGGFVYPLIPGKSPILKSGERMYMFPDLKSEDGASVGVSLETASKAEIAELDELLTQLACLKTTEEVTELCEDEDKGVGVVKTEEATWGTSVAGGIDKGVSWVSRKISLGTEVAGSLIVKGASKLRDHIDPNEREVEVPASVQKGVHYTRRATGGVVGVSDYLMTSLAKLTVKVGTGVKGLIEESEYVKGQEVNPHAKEAWKATKSGLKGAAGVFTDLKNGASILVKETGKEASRTVGHKYGGDAEKVTSDGLSIAGNTTTLLYTYWSWKTWGITFIGKVGEVVTKETREKETSRSVTKADK